MLVYTSGPLSCSCTLTLGGVGHRTAQAGGGAQQRSNGLEEPHGSYSIRKDTRKLETLIETQLAELEVCPCFPLPLLSSLSFVMPGSFSSLSCGLLHHSLRAHSLVSQIVHCGLLLTETYVWYGCSDG